VNPMQRLPVLTQLQKLNHKENQTSLMARAGFLLVRLSMHPSGSDNQSTNPMRGNNMNPMQGNEGSMSNEMGTRGRPSVGRFPTAWSFVELLPGALIRGVKSLSSHRAHFGPFASLLSAGVSLFGCSQQSNANIRPFAIAVHCYFPSLDNLQLRFEFTLTQCRSRSTHKCENCFAELPS
jgi:hypothetical protein